MFMFLSVAILFGAKSGFDQFEQFEKMDKIEFNKLKSKVNKCLDRWDFGCAEDAIGKMRQYAGSRKDIQKIYALKSKLQAKREEKARRDEARRKANRIKSIKIASCSNSSGGGKMCMLYVNGRRDGFIFYHLNSDNTYQINISSSKYAKSNSGFYDPKLHRVWSTYCGDSVFGASPKKFVYSLSDALFEYAKCSLVGRY